MSILITRVSVTVVVAFTIIIIIIFFLITTNDVLTFQHDCYDCCHYYYYYYYYYFYRPRSGCCHVTTPCSVVWALSPIGRIQILTYLIWRILGAAIFDCVIRSCDLFNWFIRTCFVPIVSTSLELFFVLTMCYFSDNVSSKENIKILWLISMFYYSDIIVIKNS